MPVDAPPPRFAGHTLRSSRADAEQPDVACWQAELARMPASVRRGPARYRNSRAGAVPPVMWPS